jgi:sulfonate transport system permease protein
MPAKTQPPLPYFLTAYRQAIYYTIGILIVGIAWQITALVAGNPGLVPPFGRIFNALVTWVRTGAFTQDIIESLPRAWLSLALAAPIGVAIGLAFAVVTPLRNIMEAPLHFFRSLPPVALLPLFILWFGIGWWPKVLAATFVCTFPIAVTTIQGAMTADTQYRELAQDLELSLSQYVRKILVPATAPAVVPGLRLAAGTSFVMLYVSELGGASVGLGYRISIAQLAYQADLMLVALIVLGSAALLTDTLIAVVAQRTLHYAGKS